MENSYGCIPHTHTMPTRRIFSVSANALQRGVTDDTGIIENLLKSLPFEYFSGSRAFESRWTHQEFQGVTMKSRSPFFVPGDKKRIRGFRRGCGLRRRNLLRETPLGVGKTLSRIPMDIFPGMKKRTLLRSQEHLEDAEAFAFSGYAGGIRRAELMSSALPARAGTILARGWQERI